MNTKGYFVKGKRIYDLGSDSHIRYIMAHLRQFHF